MHLAAAAALAPSAGTLSNLGLGYSRVYLNDRAGDAYERALSFERGSSQWLDALYRWVEARQVPHSHHAWPTLHSLAVGPFHWLTERPPSPLLSPPLNYMRQHRRTHTHTQARTDSHARTRMHVRARRQAHRRRMQCARLPTSGGESLTAAHTVLSLDCGSQP